MHCEKGEEHVMWRIKKNMNLRSLENNFYSKHQKINVICIKKIRININKKMFLYLQFPSVYFCIFISVEPTPKWDESVAKSRAAFGGGGGCCCVAACKKVVPAIVPLPLASPLFPFPYTHTAIDGCRVSSGHGCCELPTVYLIDAHTDRYTLNSWLHNACELGRGSFKEAEQEPSGASEGRRLMQDLESHRSKIFLILYKSKKKASWVNEKKANCWLI